MQSWRRSPSPWWRPTSAATPALTHSAHVSGGCGRWSGRCRCQRCGRSCPGSSRSMLDYSMSLFTSTCATSMCCATRRRWSTGRLQQHLMGGIMRPAHGEQNSSKQSSHKEDRMTVRLHCLQHVRQIVRCLICSFSIQRGMSLVRFLSVCVE